MMKEMKMIQALNLRQNYSDTSGSLWQFKRDESPMNDARNPVDVSTANSLSFKYEFSILGKPAAFNNNGVLRNAKIVVPLKYL